MLVFDCAHDSPADLGIENFALTVDEGVHETGAEVLGLGNNEAVEGLAGLRDTVDVFGLKFNKMDGVTHLAAVADKYEITERCHCVYVEVFNPESDPAL